MELVTLAFADYEHPDPNATNDSATPPIAKRRKISLACEQCRIRKARCDGSKPECSNCTRRKEQCVYKITKAQSDSAQDYIESLLSKITSLEEENARLRDNKDRDERDVVTKMLNGSAQTPTNMSPQGTSAGANRVYVPKRRNSIDATGAAAHPGNPGTARQSYFGYSSTSSLIEQVMRSIGDDEDSDAQQSSTPAYPIGIDNASFEADYAGPENFSLFPRPVTDFLINRFWDRIHTLYPFIHKPTFMQSYERLWDATAKPAPRNSALGLGESGAAGPLSFPFHIALNAMLILGLQFTTLDESDKDNLTFQCLQKCKNLLKVDLFNEGSMAILQTTLLMSHFFLSTSSPNKSWVITGISCRLAQGLGLHADGYRTTQHSPIERELRKRVWFTTVSFDMITAMTLGRPVMLRRRHGVPPAEPIDDEYLLHNVSQPDNHLSDLAFFCEMNKMYACMREALSLLYKDSAANDGHKIDKTVELDVRVLKIQAELPDALHWERPIPDYLRLNRATVLQQRNVLRIRVAAARMGLHRPLFIDYCKSRRQSNGSSTATTSSLAESCHRSAAVMCIKQSIHLAEVTDMYADTDATCEWWYSLFFMRMAAAIILIADTRPELVAEVGQDNLDRGWQTCKTVLQSKLPQTELVRSCFEGFEKLHDKVHRYTQTPKSTNTTPNPMPVLDPTMVAMQSFRPPEMNTMNADDLGLNANGFNFVGSNGLYNMDTNQWSFGFDDFTAPFAM